MAKKKFRSTNTLGGIGWRGFGGRSSARFIGPRRGQFPHGWTPGGGEGYHGGGAAISQKGSRRFCGVIADGQEDLYSSGHQGQGHDLCWYVWKGQHWRPIPLHSQSAR